MEGQQRVRERERDRKREREREGAERESEKERDEVEKILVTNIFSFHSYICYTSKKQQKYYHANLRWHKSDMEDIFYTTCARSS